MPDLAGFLLGGGSLILLGLIFVFVDDLSDGSDPETNLVGGYGPQPKPNPERQAANDDRPPLPRKGRK